LHFREGHAGGNALRDRRVPDAMRARLRSICVVDVYASDVYASDVYASDGTGTSTKQLFKVPVPSDASMRIDGPTKVVP
jgi:hypothetical protein